MEMHRQMDDKERTIWTLGVGDHGPHPATAAAEHRILLAVRAPRLEQTVRTNAELAMYAQPSPCAHGRA
jgi:hypothetical protein